MESAGRGEAGKESFPQIPRDRDEVSEAKEAISKAYRGHPAPYLRSGRQARISNTDICPAETENL